MKISIHAPLAGCDLGVWLTEHMKKISIHAPLAGCDDDLESKLTDVKISIHAPLAGCDLMKSKDFTIKLNFNPRTPCGVRPLSE